MEKTLLTQLDVLKVTTFSRMSRVFSSCKYVSYFEIDAVMDEALPQGARGVDETVSNVNSNN